MRTLDGEKLYQFRIKHKISQTEIGEIMGIHKDTVQRLETANVKRQKRKIDPKLWDKLHAWEKLLNVSN